ncbi:permease [Pukyongia salina]|uniref:Permease n=1 Tax=Pukyongia salina TaxID=2094025 RepID=A0A2S0HXE9_9FLAO|nr:DMT family transporter [Pukyongia salina]AVI50843.1 permease [Pukyongia salina]
MGNNSLKWIYLVILSLIWGSSFILIKKGLVGLTDIQVGALRIVLTSIILFSVGFKSIRTLKKTEWKWVAITGFIGSFFPPFFFAIAQNHIDSAVASILNSLTPLSTVVVGMLFLRMKSTWLQILGVIIGLLGTLILLMAGAEINPNQNYWFSILVIIATIGYAFNVNLIKKYLSHANALAITTGNFIWIFLPALILLIWSGFFETIFNSPEMQLASIYVAILSLVGTAVAKVLFNRMIQISSPVFSSSVTYTMPIVAVGWGVLDGESFELTQIFAAGIILVGVYLSNKRRGAR